MPRSATQKLEDLNRRITIDPEVCNGRPTLRGKRITVQTILEFLTAGESRREILRQYPSLESADIDACLAFATKLMSHGFVFQKLA
ncbi:MAG TPA: DUF433 domain-containing protein [Thermoanaerobaculia bacterium]|nr:DUF433 domain-containing protein [Thermoanaerobaculia bacterium]